METFEFLVISVNVVLEINLSNFAYTKYDTYV